MALKFNCMHCSHEITTRYLAIGEMAKCPQCNELTEVPNSAETVEGASSIIADRIAREPQHNIDNEPVRYYPAAMIKRGRLLTWLVIAASLYVSFMVLLLRPDTLLGTGGFRLVLSLVLLYFLFRGVNWVRWYYVVVMSLGGFFILFNLLSNLANVSAFGLMFASIMTIVNLGGAAVLLFSPSVEAFLYYQRMRRIGKDVVERAVVQEA